MMNFNPGDIVELKSGSGPMTVESYEAGIFPGWRCVWMAKGVPKTNIYPSAVLRAYVHRDAATVRAIFRKPPP